MCRIGFRSIFPSRARVFRALCICAAGLAAPAARAAAAPLPVLRQLRVEVALRDSSGQPVRRAMAVTVEHAPGATHPPFVLLLHGRPAGVSARRRMGLVQFPAAQDWLAGLGYFVVVPTRVGYGITGGPDVEATGPCGDKDFARGMAAVVTQTRQLLHSLQARYPAVDWSRGLVLGDSTGGIAALAVAAARLPGVRGVIDISAGDGGDSVHHPYQPCGAWRMARTLGAYGRRARVPALWMYSRNDGFWGRVWPRRWFDAYVDAGGSARFVELPADKNNGHFIFTRNLPDWQPGFIAFAAGLGLP